MIDMKNDLPVLFNQAANATEFLVTNSKVYTYEDLKNSIHRLNGFYQSQSVAKVIVAMSDTWLRSVVILTNLLAGKQSFIVDPGSKPSLIESIVKQSNADLLVCNDDLSVTIPSSTRILKAGEKVKKSGGLLGKFIKKKPSESAGPETLTDILIQLEPVVISPGSFDDQQPVYVLYTSGTTSAPKGVEISYSALMTHLQTFKSVYGYQPGDRLLNLLPMHHADGLIQGLFLNVFCGSTWIRPFDFSIQQLPDLAHAFQYYKATHFITVPTILSFMNQFIEDKGTVFDYPAFKFTVSSASRLDVPLWESVIQNFKKPVYNMFGMTETVTGGLFCGPADDLFKMGTVGKPVDCEVKVVEATESTPGELMLKGPNVMLGYYQNETETQAVLQDGWLRTGDLATIDVDGFVTIVGRKKNMVIRGGVNIYPEEITELLNSHADVTESVVIGLEDEQWGEKLVAAVVLLNGHQTDTNGIKSFLQTALPAEKVPDDVLIMSELPKGPSGKVLLNEVRALYAVQSSASSGSVADIAIEAKVIELAAKTFGVPATSLTIQSAATNTKGWDSLGHMNLIVALEKEFGVKFSTKEVISADRLNVISTFITSKMK